jgi:hypothetical protein
MKRVEVPIDFRGWLHGLRSEIGANMVLAPKDEYNKGWNEASLNAIKFIDRYANGDGLFQISTKNE